MLPELNLQWWCVTPLDCNTCATVSEITGESWGVASGAGAHYDGEVERFVVLERVDAGAQYEVGKGWTLPGNRVSGCARKVSNIVPR